MTEMKYRIALMALAVACAIAAPAFSAPDDRMPANKSSMNIRHEGCPFLAGEELNNMTFGQLQEMRQQAQQNNTFCQAKGWRQDRGEGGCMGGRADRNGEFHGFDHDGAMGWGMPQDALILLLMDDVSVDKLNNMTAEQINALQQTKMNALNNMTMNQIQELQQKRMQEQDNMTWKELKEENRKIRQISEIMDWAHFRHDDRDSACENGSIPQNGASEDPARGP